MKTISTVICSLTSLFLLSLCTSCIKNKCTNVATGQNPFIYLELKNTQNKNLFDPATTGHFDTAMIKKLNAGLVNFTRPGAVPVAMSFDYTTVAGNRIINITSTDQDTLYIATAVNADNCSIIVSLQSVNYNGVALKDSSSFFIAHK